MEVNLPRRARQGRDPLWRRARVLSLSDVFDVGDSPKERLSGHMAVRGRVDFACKEPRVSFGKRMVCTCLMTLLSWNSCLPLPAGTQNGFVEEVAFKVCLKDGAGWCSGWREQAGQSTEGEHGVRCWRDLSEFIRVPEPAVLLAVTWPVRSWVRGRGKKAGLHQFHFLCSLMG